jgi:hypothetical protein
MVIYLCNPTYNQDWTLVSLLQIQCILFYLMEKKEYNSIVGKVSM